MKQKTSYQRYVDSVLNLAVKAFTRRTPSPGSSSASPMDLKVQSVSEIKMIFSALREFLVVFQSNVLLFHSIRALAFSLRGRKELESSEHNSVTHIIIKNSTFLVSSQLYFEHFLGHPLQVSINY
jgi:hypothetical protein